MKASMALRLVVVAYLLLALVYAWIAPPLEGFDALAHFGYAAYLRQERRLPVIDPALVERSYELVVHPPLYYAAIALATAPLPMDAALTYARAADNPYHDKSLSLRQTITLPTEPIAVKVTFWAARLVSMIGGLVTLLGAYALWRTLLPARPWLAVAAAAVTGLNPQFLFNAVTITNDAWVPALAVVTLWLLARATRLHTLYEETVPPPVRGRLGGGTVPPPVRGRGPFGRGGGVGRGGGFFPRDFLLVGISAGLAALTKYSCLLLVFPALLLFWPYWRRTGWRSALAALAWMVGAAVAIASFWYVRNLVLYGSLLPLDAMAVALPTMQRPQPMSLTQLIATIPWLFTGFWGVFVSIIAPPRYLQVTTWGMILAAAGLLIWLARQWRRSALTAHAPARAERFAVLFALVWFGAIFAGVLHWTRTIMFGEQGRLLHAAGPALALLFVLGWQAWLPRRWQVGLAQIIPVLFVGLAIWPLPTLQRAYALPLPIPAPVEVDRPIMATFAGGMQLVGVDFPQGAALGPGERLPVTLIFDADQEIPANYTLFIHLAAEEDALLYQFDGVPDRGRHPTRQWQPGVTFADKHTLSAKPVLTDTLATLSIGFYDYQDPNARQPVFDASGAQIGDRLVLGQVRVTAQPIPTLPIQPAPQAQWERDVQLLTAAVTQNEAGDPATVSLRWQATADVQTDYTIFAQLLDAANQVVAQVDQQPQQGRAPTSTWRAGEVIEDTFNLPPPNGSWSRVILGLYDGEGRRPLLSEPNAGQDFVVLLQNNE